MLHRHVRVTTHHRLRFPATQLLQHPCGHVILPEPARPGMPQVVPAKIGDPRPLERSSPMFRVHLPDRSSGIGEHVLALLAHLPLEDRDREIVEWNTQRLVVLGVSVLDRDDAAGKST